jgi:hypothetical protein
MVDSRSDAHYDYGYGIAYLFDDPGESGGPNEVAHPAGVKSWNRPSNWAMLV